MCLDVSFKSIETELNVGMDKDVTSLKVGFSNGIPNAGVPLEHEVYSGTYEVTPSVDAQKLKTKNKLMQNDLIVKEIPSYTVSNKSDGMTIIIGGL